MTTLASLITQLREDRLNEPSEGFWRNVTLRRAFNEGLKDIARKTLVFQTETTIAIVAGTQSYSAPTNLCSLLEPTTFTPTGSSLKYPIEQIDYHAARYQWGVNSAITQNLPTQIASRGYPGTTALSLLLFPIPSVAGTLHIYYAKYPTALSTTGSEDTDDIDIPTGWDDLLLDYAEYKAYSLMPGPDATARAAAALSNYRTLALELAEAGDRWSTRGGNIEFDPWWSVNSMTW